MPEQKSRLVIEIDSVYAKQNAQALARELDSIERKGEFATKSMDSMSVSVRNLAGYMAGFVTVGSAISKMDAYTGINNKLKLVTKSQEELNQAMAETFAIAQRSASSWSAVNDVYSKYMSNAKTLNLTQSQTARLTEITSKAVAISGSSAEAAAAALFQYGQALDGGVLRAEEFNSLVDGAGGLLNAMATGLGVTRGELRQMMLDGKLTGDVITEALLKAGDSVDQLFGKTDITIGQSLSQLGNAVTKFTGEAGQASGAAQILISSISMLGQNLEAVANIGMLGGVALLTKAIVTQTVAVKASINATIEKRLAMTADLQMQTQLAAVEVQRTRLAAAQALTEMNLARAEFNSATTRQARSAATMRLTQVEIAHNIAVKNSTVAIAAQITAENALNASRAVGARMLALVGGPIGAITLGVTALAAGYMYFSSRAAEANQKLEEQAQVARKASEELEALKGLEKDKAVDDMTASFERQNVALAESSSKINMQLNAIEQLYKGNKEVVQVVQDARNGTISMTNAVQRFNELRVSKEVYESVKANTVEFEKNAKEATNTKEKLKIFGIEVELAGRKAQTSVAGVDGNTEALKDNKDAADAAAKAQKGFFDSLNSDVLSANERIAYMNLGFSKEVIDQINKLQEAKQKALGDGVTAIVTSEEIKQIVAAQNALDAVKQKEDEITEAKRKQTRESEKQLKVLQVNAKVQANAAKYNFSSVESKYNLPQGTLSALHMIESKGNANAYNKSTGATGGFQFLSGTAKQYGVNNRNDLGQSAEGAGKYMSYLLDLFKGDLEKAVRAYHAGEGNVQKGKNIGKYNNQYWADFQGYMAGISGFSGTGKDFEKSIEDYARLLDEQAKSRKALELQVSDEVTKIRENLKDKLLEIDKAGFSPERTKELKAEYQARADDEIAIAEYALKTKLDDYSVFKKTEDDLLKDSFNQKKFYVSKDIELSKQQKEEAIKLLDEQYQHELELIQLAKEQRIFQMREALLSETAAMEERYRLEREQILNNSKLSKEQKQQEIALSNAKQQEEVRNRLNQAVQNWGGIQADMNGTTEQWRLEQDRFSRTDASQELFDSKMSSIDQMEKDPNADLGEIARMREQIWFEHHERLKAIESDYQISSMQLQLSYGEQMASSMSTMMGAIFGEKSRAYAAAFAVEKAFAVAQAALAMGQNIAEASKMGFPYNIPMIAGAMAQGAQIASIISSVAQPTGYSDGGFTGYGAKYDPAGIVHKGEVVWSQEDIKRWGGVAAVESMRTSQPPKGYANGGIVSPWDTNRMAKGQLDAIQSGANLQAERQAQANAKVQAAQPSVNLNPNFVIVDERESLSDYLFSPDGTKAFVKFFKRNRSALGI